MGFKSPSLFWWILIFFGAGLNALYSFVLEPPFFWNPFGFITDNHVVAQQYCQFIFWYILVLLHVLEGSYALFLALRSKEEKRNAMQWFIQTLLLGYASLGLLKREIAKQHDE